jgi:hypothetical protein
MHRVDKTYIFLMLKYNFKQLQSIITLFHIRSDAIQFSKETLFVSVILHAWIFGQ